MERGVTVCGLSTRASLSSVGDFDGDMVRIVPIGKELRTGVTDNGGCEIPI